MEQVVSFLGIPGTIGASLLVFWTLLQLVGEICELKGKIVPEFMKIRKLLKRKRDEKKQQKELLQKVQELLNGITAKNNWVDQINEKTKVYDSALNDLAEFKQVIADNNALTLDLYINVNRNRIIDFASKVANEDILISREEFKRIFKVYEEYEDVLKKHKMKNGEVDIAYTVIVEAYEERLKDHNFLEDIRGYQK